MNVFIKGLNACGMRKTNIDRYRNFVVSCGHNVTGDPGRADIILLWTCGFRKDYRDNCVSEIIRYQDEFKAELIIAGCLPGIDGELVDRNFKGRIVQWNREEEKMQEYFGPSEIKLADTPFCVVESKVCDDIDEFKRSNPQKDVSFVDRFAKLFVAEGCRFECAYCSERLVFPPYRSFPPEYLIKECTDLVKRTGQKEVILLADSLGDYGHDIGLDLPALLQALKKIDPDLKFALQGLNPAHFLKFSADLEILIKRNDIIHLQLPIQSASDRILRLMKRPYAKDEIEAIFTRLYDLGFSEIDTHLIVGFPGETEEDCGETVEFILRHHPKYVLVSSFMETSGMPAAQLPDKVPEKIKKMRVDKVASRIKAEGIICNSDNSDLSRERFRTLNLIS